MSNSTINLSYNEFVGPHKNVHICLPAERPYNNVSLSLSPDSSSSIANHSDGEASSSSDTNMLYHFQNEGSFVNNLENTSPREDRSFCNTIMSLDQTCVPTPFSGHVDFSNTSSSAQNYQATKQSHTCNGSKKNGSDSIVTDIIADGKLSSCQTSQRGSTEDDTCSMSSGEMVLRSNSFCLTDQTFLVFSSLEESSTSPSAGHAALHNESDILTTPALPVLCGKNTENLEHPYIGMIFTMSKNCEYTAEEDHTSLPISSVTPDENHRGLQTTFVCEESPDHKKWLACVESEALGHLPGALPLEKCISFEPSLSTKQDMDKCNQTSTPIQNIGSQMPASLLKYCPEYAGSPILFSNEQQEASSKPTKHAVERSPSARKMKKIEMNWPKSNSSIINSEVVTTVQESMLSESSPQREQPQKYLLSKCDERPRGTSKISPTKLRNRIVFVPLATKRANSAQRQVIPGAPHLNLTIKLPPESTGTCNSSISTTGIKSAPVAQCSKASTDVDQTALCQVEHSPAQSAVNQTFCLSSPQKSPAKSFQKDQKPTPKKSVSSKIDVRSVSALRPVNTRPRCSSETLSSSSQPSKQKKMISMSPSTITIPRHENQTKSATLNNSSRSKLALQTEASKTAAANASPPLRQVEHSPAQSTGNQTFCLISPQKSPAKSFRKDQKLTPKKNMSSKIEVRSVSALRPVNTRPRCSSETLSSSEPSKQRKTISTSSSTITIPRHEKQAKPATLNNSSCSKLALQTEASKRAAANTSPTEVNNVNRVTESGRKGSATLEKSRRQGQTSPNQRQGTYLPQPSIASPRPATKSIGQRPGDNLAVGTAQSKKNRIAGSHRNWATGKASLEPAPAAHVKPKLNISQPLATPIRSSFSGPPPTPTSRLPSRSLKREHIHSDQNEGAASTQVSRVTGTAHKQTPVKGAPTKTRWMPTHERCTGPIVPINKPSSTYKGASTSSPGPLKRTGSSRFVGLTPSKPVEKNKPKTSSRKQVSTSQAKENQGPPDVVPPSLPRDDRNDQRIQNLGGLLAASNCRFQAITIVLQHILSERDEATGHCQELAQQLVNLRGELECSVNSSERLEKEKQDLQDALECAMRRLQKQHQKDLEEMEQRLQAFYQAEWDKVHLSYQGEADKYKALLQTQMEQLEGSHDTLKLELERSHEEQLQCVKQQHEQSLEELKKFHTQQLESLDESLKDSEVALIAQIQVLTQENADLLKRLTSEENKRRELAEGQKDSHTVYLEQELESLKVVLDIKNKQLHQQEKMMIKIDELLEKNVKLDESLKKVQQENEDLKARMERYSMLSKQLLAEQAVLQESLQKESKVNKHLSMENEELLWKLHNGEPSSPQKASPTSVSPSHSFSLQSPPSPGACSPFPLSPR
ncbi:microtubule-associated tumor suppressor 1 homolog A isoform X2 [Syngnathus scovelli]|uniref:microtubule-associated tumor suppressor 1 homolog A isoform X2 n=1 Tax=Syngnathus scovelli TaxID=161590 RepID=UPI002110978D|nr:microtubule-associated tumor suppressor 1 homolog A isoform X2 [Syngnathus scovelli]